MPIPTVIPYPLGFPSGTGLYTPSGVLYDFALGSLPLLSAATNEHPYQRETAPYRKAQFDSQTEPGEQSIDGWWLRSQMSFHGGAGQLYADPSAADSSFSTTRYYTSSGVDPWTPGVIRLLPRTDLIDTSPIGRVCGSATKAIGVNFDTAEVATIDAGVVSNETSPAAALSSVAADGLYFYVAGSDGIWRRLISASPGAAWTKIWDIVGSPAQVKIGVVKERLVLATDLGVYELVGAGPALPTPVWTPPSAGWNISTSPFAESSTAIYVSGNTANRGYVLAFTLDSGGSMPTLTSGAVVAQLPFGELVNHIFGYLGKFLAFGTSRGARVAEIQSDGGLELGPILFEGSSGPFAAQDQFLYVAGNLVLTPDAGIYRIDLGTELSPLRFAYAPDLVCDDGGGTVYSVVFYDSANSRMLLTTPGGVYERSLTGEFVDVGTLQSARVRYGTLEPKVFKLLRVRGEQTPADFFVSVIDDLGTEHDVIGYVADQIPGAEDAEIPDIGPQDFVSVKFTLSSDPATHLLSAEAAGYQLKSLPATPRRRLLTVPVWLFDFESDANGVGVGFVGSALERLQALEDLDTAADVVSFQDFMFGRVERVAIENVRFVLSAPPGGGFSGPGGLVILTLRTV